MEMHRGVEGHPEPPRNIVEKGRGRPPRIDKPAEQTEEHIPSVEELAMDTKIRNLPGAEINLVVEASFSPEIDAALKRIENNTAIPPGKRYEAKVKFQGLLAPKMELSSGLSDKQMKVEIEEAEKRIEIEYELAN